MAFSWKAELIKPFLLQRQILLCSNYMDIDNVNCALDTLGKSLILAEK